MRQGQKSKISEQAARIIALVKTHGRARGEQAIRHLGSDALPVAQELLQHSLEQAKRNKLPWFLPGILLATLLFILWAWPALEDGTLRIGLGFLFPCIFYYLVFVVMWGLPASLLWLAVAEGIARFKKRREPIYPAQEMAVCALSNMDDRNAVGLLLEVAFRLKYRLETQTIESALSGLNRLLPRLQEEEAQSLTGSQRESLYGLLIRHSDFVLRQERADGPPRGTPFTYWDIPLTKSILHVYRYIGDAGALRRVTTLANIEDMYTTKESRLIREAARECLPYLQEQIEAVRCSKSLLRASHVPDAAPETLLRPLAETGAVHSDQLLRVGVSEEPSRE
jgi:hypothetical protein